MCWKPNIMLTGRAIMAWVHALCSVPMRLSSPLGQKVVSSEQANNNSWQKEDSCVNTDENGLFVHKFLFFFA